MEPFSSTPPRRTLLRTCTLAALTCLLAAPAVWADSGGDDGLLADAYIGKNGGSGNTAVVIDTLHTGSYSAYGGYSSKDFTPPGIDPSGSANNNTLTIESNGQVAHATGGRALGMGSSIETNDNTLIIKGTVTAFAFGGNSDGSAARNSVIIEGGSVTGDVYGGYAWDGSATHNTITLNSGSVTGDVYGGETSGHSVTHNTITLNGGSVTGSVLGGYVGWGLDCVTGNTLNVGAKGVTVGADVTNFDTLNFTLPADIAAGDTLLDVGGMATFPAASTSVSITMADGATLEVGDTINLITAAGGLTVTPKEATISDGDYEFEVSTDADNLIAKVTKAKAKAKPDLQMHLGMEDGKFVFKAQRQGSATITNASSDAPASNVTWVATKGGRVLDSGTIASIAAGASADIVIRAEDADLNDSTVCVRATAAEDDANPADNEACGMAVSVPTTGGLGLLLSGLALAGAAAPALRRREKQGKKVDTRQ
ncbi:MAG: hypothetical protein IJM64_01340 [Ottowia sp.]|nr:hypothetical protein [Ottowia sp.]